VLVEGRPAARVTDLVGCPLGPEAIITGDPTVLVGGLPDARLSDSTGHAGKITKGAATVLVGDGGGGAAATVLVGDGGGGAAATAAAATGSEVAPLDPAGLRACWDELVASDRATPDAWRAAALADGRSLSRTEGGNPKEDFACFAALFVQAGRKGLGSAQALYRAFPNRFRALDLRFPNGIPERPLAARESEP